MIRKIVSMATKSGSTFTVGANGVESILYMLSGLQGLNSLAIGGSYKVLYAPEEDLPGVDSFALVPANEMATVGYIEYDEKSEDKCEVPDKEPEQAPA